MVLVTMPVCGPRDAERNEQTTLWIFTTLLIFTVQVTCDKGNSTNVTLLTPESAIGTSMTNMSSVIPPELNITTEMAFSDEEDDDFITGSNVTMETFTPTTIMATTIAGTTAASAPSTATTTTPMTTMTTTTDILDGQLSLHQTTEDNVTSSMGDSSTQFRSSYSTEASTIFQNQTSGTPEQKSSALTSETPYASMNDTVGIVATTDDILNTSQLPVHTTTHNVSLTPATSTTEPTTAVYSQSDVWQSDTNDGNRNATSSMDNTTATSPLTTIERTSGTTLLPVQTTTTTTAITATTATTTTATTLATKITTLHWISLEQGTARLHIFGINLAKFNTRHGRAAFRILIAKYLTLYCDNHPQECTQLKEQHERCRCENVIIKQSSLEQDHRGLEVSIFIKQAFFRNRALVTKETLHRTINMYTDELRKDFGYKIELVKRDGSKSDDASPETWVIIVAVAAPGCVLILLFVFIATTYRRRSTARYQNRTPPLSTGRTLPTKKALERSKPKTFDNPAFDTVNEASGSSTNQRGDQWAKTTV